MLTCCHSLCLHAMQSDCILTMTSIRIIIKIKSKNSALSKKNFLKLCHSLKIKIKKIIESSNDLIVHCMNNLKAEKKI